VDDTRRAERLGADAVLMKPVEATALRETVWSLLQRAGDGRARPR
jgi:hypothetical protein